ncbi:MAG: pseudouridine synthase [Planctomycetota bacterium]
MARRPAPSPSETGYRDKARGPRLQRTLAEAGVAARRVCEQLILDGHVEVNGQIVDYLPAFADPAQDRITVDGRTIKSRNRKLYVMLNKPTRTVTTTADEPELDRRTVLDLVDHPAADRLYPVGRLDFDTTGLVLLTNDGELANQLTHPKFGVAKTYHAVVKGRLTDDDARELAQGIYLAERKAGRTTGAARTARVGVTIHKRDRDRTVLELVLNEGRNRQVRRMLAAVGCPVKKLERVAMGPVRLTGLPRGAWRELRKGEVDSLKRAVRRGKRGDGGETPVKAGTRSRRRDDTAGAPTLDSKRMKRAVSTAGRDRPSASPARPSAPPSPRRKRRR